MRPAEQLKKYYHRASSGIKSGKLLVKENCVSKRGSLLLGGLLLDNLLLSGLWLFAWHEYFFIRIIQIVSLPETGGRGYTGIPTPSNPSGAR
jgi:hypothetical protein